MPTPRTASAAACTSPAHTLDAICELFPMFRRMRMLRNWGGIVDVTPDRSPIIGKTPVPGLYVNCGWGTGGFKATPGSGARVRPDHRARRAASDQRAVHARPLPRRLPDRRGRGGGGGALKDPRMLLIHCPYCGTAAGDRIPAMAARPMSCARQIRPRLDDAAWAEYLYMRANPKGVHAERWRHAHGCGALFQRAARHRQRSCSSPPTRPASRGPDLAASGRGR